jgi:hypothetical protein
MKRLCLLMCVLAAGTVLHAQSTNPIAGARQPGGTTTLPNPMWAAAGVVGGIPTIANQCGSTLASTSSPATINTAITNCSNAGGGFVSLGAGTFTINGALILKNNVVLRGQGMNTDLNITSFNGSTWFWANQTGAIVIQGVFPEATDSVPPLEGVPAGTHRTWSGTNGQAGVYAQGARVVNLATAPTGLSVGDTLVLWQNNVPDASLPNSGFFFSAKTGSNAIAWQGSSNDHGASQEQRSRVTAINGNAVTIADPLAHPTGAWTTAQAPKAGWLTVSRTIHDVGLENMRIRTTNLSSVQNCVICVAYGYNIWIKGVGLQPRFTSWHAGGAVDFGMIFNDSHHVTVRDSWIDTMRGGGVWTTTSYGVAFMETHHFLVENNIFNNVESPTELLIGSMGGVVGYNYERFVGDNQQEGGIQQHEVSSSMNLVEGNTYYKLFADVFHGNSALSTYFRNHMSGRGFDLWSYHRFFNLIGNVINASTVRKTLATDGTKYDRWASYAFRLGYPQEGASSATSMGVALDARVWTSAFIWGNYATVGGSVFDSAEVPSSDPVFPNPVPPTQALPASLYHSARPPFFTLTGIGTRPWPLNGPDVTGGAFLAGHANKTPAQLVYEASGGSVANFNPGLYGTTSGSGAPAAPSNLRVAP